MMRSGETFVWGDIYTHFMNIKHPVYHIIVTVFPIINSHVLLLDNVYEVSYNVICNERESLVQIIRYRQNVVFVSDSKTKIVVMTINSLSPLMTAILLPQ